MSNRFHLRIFEADNVFFEGEAESVIVPTIDGEYGVLADHENIVVPIEPGQMVFRPADGKDLLAAVSSGMMRVENGDVLILVESAEHPEDIDAARAREEAAAAKEAMLQKRSAQEYMMAEAALRRQVARLKVYEELK